MEVLFYREGSILIFRFKAKQMKDDMNLALETCLESDVCSGFLWERTLNIVFPMDELHIGKKQVCTSERFEICSG